MLKKKSLGQHFLRDPRILEKIADAAKLSKADAVLEVGPGEGTLTELLLEKAGRVIAVEKDDRLIPVLQQKFAAEISSGKLELVHADILNFSPTHYSLLSTHYKLVANIPYYITGALLRKFLESQQQPSAMVLLLQKEVARRIVGGTATASPKLRRAQKESILSISVKAYGMPRYVDTVKAGSFSPPPKVDSGIIAIEGISKNFFRAPLGHLHVPHEDAHHIRMREHRFFALLKKGFAHPRKLLTSNLDRHPEQLAACGIPEKARPEELSAENWRCLALV